jgi:hypothetical protein
MVNEPPAPDLHALWQNQPAEGVTMSVAEVRRKSQELHDKARRRVLAIYLMGAGNAGLPLILIWFVPELRFALGYLVLTALALVYYVRRRSSLRALPPEVTPAQSLAFYRQLLERERDYRRESARWFTIGPGLNIIVLGLAYVSSPLFRGTTPEILFMASVLLAHAVVLTRAARRLGSEARKYQVELDGLPAAVTPS